MGRIQKPRRRREGYQHKSSAICVVVYDQGGHPLSDVITTEVLNSVTEIALREGLLVSFTRT